MKYFNILFMILIAIFSLGCSQNLSESTSKTIQDTTINNDLQLEDAEFSEQIEEIPPVSVETDDFDNNVEPFIIESLFPSEWIYNNGEIVIQIYDNGSYAVTYGDISAYAPNKGAYEKYNENTLALFHHSTSTDVPMGFFEINADEILKITDFDGIFKKNTVKIDTPAQTSYFDELNLSAIGIINGGKYEFEDSGVYFNEDGSFYHPVKTLNEVVILNDIETSDGYREITFTASSYFLASDTPDFEGEINLSSPFGFIDYYTGFILPVAGFNEITIPFNNEEIVITISSNVRNEFPETGEYVHIKHQDLFVRIPKDYDGLVYCVGKVPITYELTNLKEPELDENGDTILDRYSYEDVKTALFFRVY